MKLYLTTLLLCLSVHYHSIGRQVMSWIPVYGISNCKSMMNDATKSQWIKNGITHIGLQFWVPGDNGSVVFSTEYKYPWQAATISQDVQDIVSWGNSNQVKTMLCLHNVRTDDFDWNLTKEVIHTYPAQTVDTVMKLVNHYGLDGVDIDFEGIGDFISDKPAFISFLNLLGTSLHAAGKELSVDIFSTPCYNTPNPSWESAMAPHVDFINLMGYNDTYENNNTKFSYCPQMPSEANAYALKYSYIENFLTVKQNVASSKLNYGLPAWQDNWGEDCLHEHILDILDISAAGGIAIWDLQLTGEGFWIDPVSWQLISLFKENYSAQQIRSQLPVCGIPTGVQEPSTIPAQLYYDATEGRLHLPAETGQLSLYSPAGVLERRWRVQGEKSISLDGMPNGFYLVQFETESNLYAIKVSRLE